MSLRLDEFNPDVEVVLITFTSPENVVGYQASNQLPFPILIDKDRSIYQAYGLGRGSFLRVNGFRAWRKYWQIFRETGFRRLESSTEDTLQLGGDFVIDAEGRLVWGFWGDGPDDRPSVDELIAAVGSG